MAQSCFAEFDPTANGGQFGLAANGNVILRLIGIFQDADSQPVRKDVIGEIDCEIPNGTNLAGLRDLMVTALVNEGTRRGYAIPRTRVVIPSFQLGV